MDIYERLREFLDSHPTAATKSKSIDDIMRILFTKAEAAVAVSLRYKKKCLP